MSSLYDEYDGSKMNMTIFHLSEETLINECHDKLTEMNVPNTGTWCIPYDPNNDTSNIESNLYRIQLEKFIDHLKVDLESTKALLNLSENVNRNLKCSIATIERDFSRLRVSNQELRLKVLHPTATERTHKNYNEIVQLKKEIARLKQKK